MFSQFKSFLEKIDYYRDRLLFLFIKRYWPRSILPNHLTILRIILGILLIILLLFGFKNTVWIIVIFCIAILTDLFDGSVARALDKTTKVGAVLDSLADRVLIWPIAVFILIFQHFWLLIILVVPELLNAGLYLYCTAKKTMKPKANIFSKTKMVIECIAFGIIILFNFPNPPSKFPISLLYIAVCLLLMDLAYKIIVFKKELGSGKA